MVVVHGGGDVWGCMVAVMYYGGVWWCMVVVMMYGGVWYLCNASCDDWFPPPGLCIASHDDWRCMVVVYGGVGVW